MTVPAAAFVLAGGWVHVREWLDTYRSVPAEVPGAAVVRVGFPVNGAISVALVLALVLTARASRRVRLTVLAGATAFEALSIAALVLSRRGGVLGWMEPGWTPGSEQSAAVAVGALLALGFAAGVLLLQPRPAAPARVRARR